MKPYPIGTSLSVFMLFLCAASGPLLAACPGRAALCEDFEHGTRLRDASGDAVTPRIGTAGENHLLMLRGDGRTSLLPQAPVDAPYYVEARLRPAAGGIGTPRQAW
jgi:hypothetical protein